MIATRFLCSVISTTSTASCQCSGCAIVIVPYNNKSTSFNVVTPMTATTTLVIQQEQCDSCGYTLDMMTANFKDTAVLTYVGKTAAVAATTTTMQPVGGNTVQCFTFNVKGAGKASVPFYYYQPWNNNMGSQSVVELTVATGASVSGTQNTLTAAQQLALDSFQTINYSLLTTGAKPNTSEGDFIRVITKMLSIMMLIIFY